MSISNFPKAVEKFEIQAYKRPRNLKELLKSHVAFTGSPHKNAYEADRITLITDPNSTNTFYYEFYAKDISYVEELPNLVNLKGEAILMVRIWVKKQSIAVLSTPFIVGDTSQE